MTEIRNRLLNISSEEMRDFVRKNFMINVEHIDPMCNDDFGKLFICLSDQNFMEYTGQDSYWCILGNLGVMNREPGINHFETNLRFAELKPNIFKNYVLFVAKKNVVNGEPLRSRGLTYGDEVIRCLVEHIESKKTNPIKKFFSKKPDERDALVDLLADLDQELRVIENRLEDEPSNQ